MRKHIVREGIKNLFNKKTLEKAKSHKSAFMDITSEQEEEIRGEKKIITENGKLTRMKKPVCATGYARMAQWRTASTFGKYLIFCGKY